MYHPLAREVMA